MKRAAFALAAGVVLGAMPPAHLRASYRSLTDPLVFDCNFYRQIHSDLSSMTCAQAESHWLTYGINEGRASSPIFAVAWYVNFYSDLHAAFCSSTCDYESAVNHFVNNGRAEGRWGHPNMAEGTPYTDYTIRVMDVTWNSYAYAFNAIRWSTSSSAPYVAVFDTEVWGCGDDPTVGDSVGARYGTAFAFGSRAKGDNLIVGRSTEDPWDCDPESTPASSHYLRYGAANPQLILDPSGTTWATYWLDVLNDSEIPSGKRLYGQGDWRHFMMTAVTDANYTHPMSSAPFWYYTGDYVTQTYWCCYFQPTSGPLIDIDMTHAAPIWEGTTGKYLATEFTTSDINATQGLIGSVTSDSEGQYLYYTDLVGTNHTPTLLRRTISSGLVTMSAPTTIKTLTGETAARYILVHYHETANRYVVLYYCMDASDSTVTPDICMQTFPDRDLTGLSIDFDHDSPTYGLRLKDDPYMPKTGQSGSQFALNQFGVRRDEHGRMFNDDVVACPYGTTVACGQVIVYVPVGLNVESGQAPWGRHVYAKTVYFGYDD